MIENINSLEIKKLRQRFVSDYKLPIQVLQSPFFEDRLEIFEKEFGAKTKYNNFIKLIDDTFDGKPQLFLEKYAEIREKIISTIKESDAFKNFNNVDLSQFKVEFPKTSKTIYTEANTNEDDNFFISFDLKKANYQAINWLDKSILLNTETYEEFIGKFTYLNYFKESKYIRQVIFGQFSPSRTVLIERYLIGKIYNFIKDNFKSFGEPFVVNSDEIIYNLSVKDFYEIDENLLSNLGNTIQMELGLNVRIEKFKLHLHCFNFQDSAATLNVFEVESLNGNTLKCVPNIYAPQIYKLLNNETPNESDRTFYYEHNLATLNNNLILNKKQEEKIEASKIDDLPF